MRALAAAVAAVLAAPPCAVAAETRADAVGAVLAAAVSADPRIPGIVAAVAAPGASLSASAGATTLGGSEKLRPDAPFRIASITKVFTAAAVLRLIEDGRLDVTDTAAHAASPEIVEALRSGGADPAAITLAALLSHTGGLYDYATDEDFQKQVVADPAHRWSRLEQIRFAMSHGKPYGAPGAVYHYSDTGYVILGDVIERASGRPMAAAIRGLLGFERLGLRSTWFETLEPAPPGLPPRPGQYLGETDASRFDPSFDLWGGGGLVSTVRDLSVFFRALFEGRVFRKPGTLALALSTPGAAHAPGEAPHALLAVPITVGGRPCWGHGGFWGSVAAFCPQNGAALALSIGQADPTREHTTTRLLGEIDAELRR